MTDKQPEKKSRSRVRINLGERTPQPPKPEQQSRVRINLGRRK